MKLIQIIPFTVLACATVHGANILVENEAFVTLNDGATIADNTGSIVIGTYGDTTPSFGTSPSAVQVLAGFTQLWDRRKFEDPGHFANYFKFEIKEALPATKDGNDIANKPVYMVIGNGDQIETSTQFLVWKKTDLGGGGNKFIADVGTQPGSPTVIRLNMSKGDLLLGSFSNGQFQLVPEPSSASLLGLAGGLILLRRRRA